MACKSGTISLVYDVNGKPTGEFDLHCANGCTERNEKCDWVEHFHYKSPSLVGVSAVFCHCTRIYEGGKVEHVTSGNPPGRLTRCDESAGMLWITEGDVCKMVPHCFGGCDDDDYECKVKEPPQEEWKTIEGGPFPRRVRVVTWECACQLKQK
ncbi:MAG TPA: hypothetical protein VK738_17630 [Terriglobales bacterium]|jgi:hypothetical protein|nr:hypothetical protein [Terriglobales bacterium]